MVSLFDSHVSPFNKSIECLPAQEPTTFQGHPAPWSGLLALNNPEFSSLALANGAVEIVVFQRIRPQATTSPLPRLLTIGVRNRLVCLPVLDSATGSRGKHADDHFCFCTEYTRKIWQFPKIRGRDCQTIYLAYTKDSCQESQPLQFKSETQSSPTATPVRKPATFLSHIHVRNPFTCTGFGLNCSRKLITESRIASFVDWPLQPCEKVLVYRVLMKAIR